MSTILNSPAVLKSILQVGQGPAGSGGNGGGSGDKTFNFTQAIPSSTWNILHNLLKFPSVSVFDSAGTMVEGDIQHIDNTRVILTFSGAFAGVAHLN